MNAKSQKLLDILHEQDGTLVVMNGGETRVFHQRGVADLLQLLKHEKSVLQGACVADKVVGKAAASLMVLGGVRSVVTDLISQQAMKVMGRSRMNVYFNKMVPFILNRKQEGLCPLEMMTTDTDDIHEILLRIEAFADKMKQDKQ